jgi:hypothetical protein
MMADSVVVVQAKWDGACAGSEVAKTVMVYGFKEGEQGILALHNREGNLWSRDVCVIWDKDEEKLARRVILEEIEVVGLQVSGGRLILTRS